MIKYSFILLVSIILPSFGSVLIDIKADKDAYKVEVWKHPDLGGDSVERMTIKSFNSFQFDSFLNIHKRATAIFNQEKITVLCYADRQPIKPDDFSLFDHNFIKTLQTIFDLREK
jgi:hypothetical protein